MEKGKINERTGILETRETPERSIPHTGFVKGSRALSPRKGQSSARAIKRAENTKGKTKKERKGNALFTNNRKRTEGRHVQYVGGKAIKHNIKPREVVKATPQNTEE